MTTLYVILGIVAVAVVFVIMVYNGLVTMQQRVKEAWSDIDVQLKRRYNLIPNLIETVRGYAKHEQQTFDRVLVSVGRTPNSSGIGLENTSVVINEVGFVEVDEQLRTADARIFAIGDLVGQPMLAHKGTREGIVAAEVIAGQKSVFEPQCIPAVVFTDPEVAWVGLTETEAKDQGREISVARFPWAASGRATTLNRNEGLTKLIADQETGLVLGVGMVGVGAGEMIAEGALAIEMGALASDLALTIHPHPTLSETLMEAAELVSGSSTHLYKPPRKKKTLGTGTKT